MGGEGARSESALDPYPFNTGHKHKHMHANPKADKPKVQLSELSLNTITQRSK